MFKKNEIKLNNKNDKNNNRSTSLYSLTTGATFYAKTHPAEKIHTNTDDWQREKKQLKKIKWNEEKMQWITASLENIVSNWVQWPCDIFIEPGYSFDSYIRRNIFAALSLIDIDWRLRIHKNRRLFCDTLRHKRFRAFFFIFWISLKIPVSFYLRFFF